MRPQAFTVGVVVALLASMLVLRFLFVGSPDWNRACVRTALWPPLVGAIVGIAADLCMRMDGGVSLSFGGMALGGGLPETIAVAILGAFAGIAGTALLLPQVVLLHRARWVDPTEEEVASAAERLGVLAWTAASSLTLFTLVIADERERTVTLALALGCILGGTGQCVRACLVRERPLAPPIVALPYRA